MQQQDRRGHHARRDDISIAFTRSEYPTPYADQRIPGSTPGHRERHLGRQYQPEDILYNHLSHACIAYGNGCDSAWVGTADHPAPPGGNYILHTKNGGKRHFDEASGLYSEQPWQPSKRIIVPPQEEERRLVPQRRGRGVYNCQDGFIHPDAEEALTRREQAEARHHLHGGKAQVDGPPDHCLAELGMTLETSAPATVAAKRRNHKPSTTTPTVAPAVGPATTAPAALPAETTSTLVQQPSTAVTTASPSIAPAVAQRRRSNLGSTPVMARELAVSHAHNGHAMLPSSGPCVPPRRGDAAEADAVAQYHRDQRMQKTLQLRKETLSAAATRAADAQVVRELPNW